MDTQKGHDGEIKTYKDLRHVGVLPPELIQRKLANGEAMRRGDVRIAPDNYEILQDALDRGIRGTLKLPLLNNEFVTVNLDDAKQFIRFFHEEGAVYTATDEELEELEKNGRGENRVNKLGIATPIDKVRLKHLQDAIKTALNEALNGATEFETKKRKMLEIGGPEFKKGIEALCRQQMEEQRCVKVHDVNITRGGGTKVGRNSGRGTCEWHPGTYPTYNVPGVAYDVEVAFPHDIPVYPGRRFDRIILNAFDKDVLSGMLRKALGKDPHRECEKWEITDLKKETNKVIMRWVFEKN